MTEFFPIIVFAFIAWFWWGATRAREIAVAAASAACQRNNVQFLDQTVVMRQMKLQRDERGGLRIARMYSFEFSSNSRDREAGYTVMLGTRLVRVHLDLLDDQPPTVH